MGISDSGYHPRVSQNMATIDNPSRRTEITAEELAAYRDPDLPIEHRVDDLLSRMTLEEKAAQMRCAWRERSQSLVDEKGNFDSAKAQAGFPDDCGLGQIARPSDRGGGKDPRGAAELTNAIQKFFIENSRLGIPVIFHEECLHGHAGVGSTSFPQPIALAGTFHPDLIERVFSATAGEARSRGVHLALAPVLDVARDARWGRFEETYGEDPYLVARLGAAAVRGFQGDGSFPDKNRVLATLKHFTGHGQPESGMNCAPTNISMRLLREIFLYPFRYVLDQAGAVAVMASYNEIDGVPSHANEWLLRGLLREEWGFKGFVVGDYYGVWELSYRPDTHGHFVARDKKEACALAVRAGVNIETPEQDCYLHLVELVREGVLKESELDELVAPMLFWKFKMGLFDDPYVDPEEADRIAGSAAHSKVALEAACDAITLLKNEGSIAPLNLEKIYTLAVIGPNADRTLLGGYSGKPRHEVTVLEGIKARVANRAKVLYCKGCDITIGGSWNQDEVVPSSMEEDRILIAQAKETAEQADVVVLAIGGNEQTSREAWSRAHMGDRARLELFGRQEELVQAVLATGKPVIVLLFNGAPLAIESLSRTVPVIFECWYLGQEGGHAVAGALFGDFSPAGKLPVTIPRCTGQLPVFYNHKPSARRGYLFDDASPLYPFGFGLSYTTFALRKVRLTKQKIRPEETTQVVAEVTNTGTREGTEVVQMYIRDRVSSVTRPVKELKGFTRVCLQPGETATIEFEITPESLAFYDVNMNYTVEPGDFEIMIGNSSRDTDLKTLVLQVEE